MPTPGCRKEWEPEEENELEPRDATMYRALVARGNCVAQDRTDVQFAVKELCRSMSNPTAGDWAALKRLGRYLVDKTRVKVRIPYQEAVRKLVVWVDTDYAGCRKTRKSTSGGVVMIGGRLVRGGALRKLYSPYRRARRSTMELQRVHRLASGSAVFFGIWGVVLDW